MSRSSDKSGIGACALRPCPLYAPHVHHGEQSRHISCAVTPIIISMRYKNVPKIPPLPQKSRRCADCRLETDLSACRHVPRRFQTSRLSPAELHLLRRVVPVLIMEVPAHRPPARDGSSAARRCARRPHDAEDPVDSVGDGEGASRGRGASRRGPAPTPDGGPLAPRTGRPGADRARDQRGQLQVRCRHRGREVSAIENPVMLRLCKRLSHRSKDTR